MTIELDDDVTWDEVVAIISRKPGLVMETMTVLSERCPATGEDPFPDEGTLTLELSPGQMTTVIVCVHLAVKTMEQVMKSEVSLKDLEKIADGVMEKAKRAREENEGGERR